MSYMSSLQNMCLFRDILRYFKKGTSFIVKLNFGDSSISIECAYTFSDTVGISHDVLIPNLLFHVLFLSEIDAKISNKRNSNSLYPSCI